MQDPHCQDCIYLGSEPLTGNWLRDGDFYYWCENEKTERLVPEELDENSMEDYPDVCKGFKRTTILHKTAI